MKKEIKFREWTKCLHRMILHPLFLCPDGYICKRDGNGKPIVSAVRFRIEYCKGPVLSCPRKTLCIWNATATDIASIIGEKQDRARWLLSDDGRINLIVRSRPSGNRRADMVKYPPVKHHTKESK